MQRTITLPDLYARKPQTPGVWLLQDSQSRCKRWQKSNLYSVPDLPSPKCCHPGSWPIYTRCMQPFCEPSQCAECCLPIHMALVASLLARFTQGSLRNNFFLSRPPTLHKNACSMGRGRQATFGSCLPPSTTKGLSIVLSNMLDLDLPLGDNR